MPAMSMRRLLELFCEHVLHHRTLFWDFTSGKWAEFRRDPAYGGWWRCLCDKHSGNRFAAP